MAKTFEEQIGFHLDELYSAALCFTLDEHRAEELLQEAAIRAFHEFPKHARDEDFRLFMLQILAATYLQRRRAVGEDPLAGAPDTPDDAFETAPEEPRPFPSPGSAAHALMRRWMGKVWRELDDAERMIVWLADIERIRHGRLAAMLGTTVAEVRWWHYRARQRLSRGAIRELGRQARGMTGA